MKTIQYLPISDIKPHPLNAAIYGDGADKDLLDDIKKRGIRSPIEVTKSFVIISGHRRFNAAQMAGLTEVPTILTDVDENDPLAVEEALITANIQRQKTPEQIAREFTRLKEIEEEKAKKRMLAGKSDPVVNLPQGSESKSDPVVNLPQGSESKSDPVVNLPQGSEYGKSRDIAAKKLGVSASNAERAAKVVSHLDTLRAEGKTEEAEQLRETLNKKSVNAAYQQIKAKKEPSKPEPEGNTWVSPEPIVIQKCEKEYEYETENEYLERHCHELEDAVRITTLQNLSLESRLKKSQEENAALKEKIKELEEKLEENEKELESERFSLGFFRNIAPKEYREIKAENESLRTRITELEKEKPTKEVPETKPVNLGEIQEKEIWYSEKGVQYWFENRENAWVIMRKDDKEEIVWNTFETKEKSQAKMKRVITGNQLQLRKEDCSLIESVKNKILDILRKADGEVTTAIIVHEVKECETLKDTPVYIIEKALIELDEVQKISMKEGKALLVKMTLEPVKNPMKPVSEIIEKMDEKSKAIMARLTKGIEPEKFQEHLRKNGIVIAKNKG